METVTPVGLPPEKGPAPDMTGPAITPAGLPPRPRILTQHGMPVTGLMLTALAGVGLVSLIGGAGRLVGRRFRGPVPPGQRVA